MSGNQGKAVQGEKQARRLLASRAKTFRTDADILEAAHVLLSLRERLIHVEDLDHYDALEALHANLQQRFFQRLDRSKTTNLWNVKNNHNLDELEMQILLVLSLSCLGMFFKISDIDDVQRYLRLSGKDRLAVVQSLTGKSRLIKAELVNVEERDVIVDSDVRLCPEVISPLLQGKHSSHDEWDVNTYEEFLDKSYLLIGAIRERSRMITRIYQSMADESDLFPVSRKIRRHQYAFTKTLTRHPNWPLRELDKLSEEETEIVLLLLGRELGFISAYDEAFTGDGLAQAVSLEVPHVRHKLQLLRRDQRLRSDDYIRVCGGNGSAVAVEDDSTLRSCEFELTKSFLDRIQVKRRRRSSQAARPAKVRFDQLILSQKVENAIRMALVQARHGSILIDKWGLGDAIPYGRAVTVLFSGEPGLGKTASAEAVAHELQKPIVVVSYAEIQNCFVGETEKNIVRVFREAQESDAVLFWDEADAMFFDRDSANRNWEVRDVNVLLQELERFEGVCILSTNRTLTLDKALERRIAIKVEFDRPNRAMREAIWKKMLPDKLPLAKGVSLRILSEFDLTGAEIKNAVLNAARRCLDRNLRGKLTMDDFRHAIRMEQEHRWSETGTGRIGFRREG